MSELEETLSCHGCGKRLECSGEEPPCRALEGWFTLSCWEGPGEVVQYSFCSLGCLKSWVDGQLPDIPGVFLESFGEDKS
jgi:hypothetical protein